MIQSWIVMIQFWIVMMIQTCRVLGLTLTQKMIITILIFINHILLMN